MNGSLTFLFFFFYLIFFSSLFIWESLERCWLFCRYIFLIAPIVGDGGRTSAIFEKKKERNGRSFHSKELISRLHGAARQTLKYLSFLYKWFLSIVGPRWHFSWRCGHWFSLRIFADVRVHRNSGGPFSLPSTCSACLIPFWFCSPFFFLFQTVIVCTVYIISP